LTQELGAKECKKTAIYGRIQPASAYKDLDNKGIDNNDLGQ
jgi:hypothetical protein